VIAAIILAAGASRRMGFPKALLTYRGTTFLETTVRASEAAGLKRLVVVLGPDSAKVLSECALPMSGVEVVENLAPETGPIASLQLGIRSVINHPVDGVLAWHVDRPHVAVATIQALVASYRDGSASIVVPSYRERRGHPVLFGRTVFGELLAVRQGHGARSVVRADPSRVLTVPVDDPAVVQDVDTPAEYQDLLRRSDASDATPPAGPSP
jgi:molybdenum cofactor cytidylyltransferase